ncbi:hypothetical protein OAD28_09140 [Flavobacteriales bacterium]|nr:hypothetical protein [Flavobacteriales bacterium]
MKNFILIFCTLIFISSCSKRINSNGSYYDFEVRCLGSELDGSVTLESYGRGRNYLDASTQAKKNAVSAVLFSGIKQGNSGCDRNAIVSEITRKNNVEFFATFFADKGPFLDYVDVSDERIVNKISRDSKKSKNIQQRKVIVNVNVLEIKILMKKNKLI